MERLELSPLSLAELEHWLLFGGAGRILDAPPGGPAVVELCTCTGELVERRMAADESVLDRLAAASSA